MRSLPEEGRVLPQPCCPAARACLSPAARPAMPAMSVATSLPTHSCLPSSHCPCLPMPKCQKCKCQKCSLFGTACIAHRHMPCKGNERERCFCHATSVCPYGRLSPSRRDAGNVQSRRSVVSAIGSNRSQNQRENALGTERSGGVCGACVCVHDDISKCVCVTGLRE